MVIFEAFQKGLFLRKADIIKEKFLTFGYDHIANVSLSQRSLLKHFKRVCSWDGLTFSASLPTTHWHYHPQRQRKETNHPKWVIQSYGQFSSLNHQCNYSACYKKNYVYNKTHTHTQETCKQKQKTKIVIIIKRISRAPIYHTRWQHRVLYNNTNHTQSQMKGWAGLWKIV